MSNILAGRGLVSSEHIAWVNGQEIKATEISMDTIDPYMIDASIANPGDVLMRDEYGGLSWRKPFDSDEQLRKEYPALEEAWGVLMQALEEYQMVKKLVMDHDKKK